MRKLFTLMMVVAFGATLSAQTPRVAFIEEATQASCPPCATLNPALMAQIETANEVDERVIFMAYQVWWPGFDPMYLDNTTEVDSRVGDYYGFGFAPQIVMQGSYVEGAPGSDPGALGNLTQSHINDIADEMSEFAMEVQATYNEVDGTVNVTGSVTAEMVATGDLRLRIALTEGTIYIFEAPGGTNGETEYHHVFKSFLSGLEGITLSTDWAVGDVYTIDETYDVSGLSFYNPGDLEIIAFVQNDDDQFVHQVTKTNEIIATTDATTGGGLYPIAFGLGGEVCEGPNTVQPEVFFQNTGNELLTSLDFVYNINDGENQTYTWTGEMGTLVYEFLTLPELTFDAVNGTDLYTLNIQVANPNGSTDDDPSDDTFEVEMALAPAGDNQVTFTLNLDQYPTETGWIFQLDDGTEIASAAAGSYTANYAEIIETFAPALGCYELIMTDTYGDGLNGAQWGGSDGSFMITDSQGNVLAEGGGAENYAVNVSKLGLTTTVGIGENTLNDAVSVYPNPANDVLNVRYDLQTSGAITFELVNTLGAIVLAETVTTTGSNQLTFNVSGLETGVYQLNTFIDGAYGSMMVSIIR